MQKTDLLVTRVPFTTATALAAGWSEDEVSRNVRSGVWVRLRHGVLLDASTHASLRDDELHRAHVVAHQLRLAAPATASHVSAAVLLGLPVLAHLCKSTSRARPRGHVRVRTSGCGSPR